MEFSNTKNGMPHASDLTVLKLRWESSANLPRSDKTAEQVEALVN